MKILYFLLCLFSGFVVLGQEPLLPCGTDDRVLPASVMQQMRILPELMNRQNARVENDSPLVCRIAVEIDSDTYTSFDKDTSAIIKNVLESIESSSLVFEREINTRLVVTNIRIWKDNDPFKGKNGLYTLIDILSSTPAASANFDKRIYLYTKKVTDAAGIGSMSGIYSVSPLSFIPTIIHELGHNFGSPHTHNCNWPGGPIDYCSSIEGNCYDRALETFTSPYIMSYCSGTRATFHPLGRTLIRNYAENHFTKIQDLPGIVSLVEKDTVLVDDFYYWSVATTASSYQISYSTSSDFQGETTFQSSFNGFSTHAFMPGKTYFLRIKAINQFGSSSWSEIKKITIIPRELGVPSILAPLQGTKVFPADSTIHLSYTRVNAATSYETQISFASNLDFETPWLSKISTETSVPFSFTYGNTFRWRVRAVKGELKGKWSDVSFFAVNPSPGNRINIPLTNLKDTPLSFPLYFYPVGFNSDVKITVTNNKNDENPLFERVYKPQSEMADVMQNLPPNTDLFLRVQEKNSDRASFPDISLIDYTIPFHTGTRELPSGLDFVQGVDSLTFQPPALDMVMGESTIWLKQRNIGFVKLDSEKLTHTVYNRNTTDGLVGYSQPASIKADKDLKIHFLGLGSSNTYRHTFDSGNEVKGVTEVGRFKSSNTINDFNPDANFFWASNSLYKLTRGALVLVKSFPSQYYVMQVETFQDKAWVLVNDPVVGAKKIVVINISNLSETEIIDYTSNPLISKDISQIKVGSNGMLWLTNSHSISYFDGIKWQSFNNSNSSLKKIISGFALSTSGEAYALTTGNESVIQKFNGTSWIQFGESIPLKNFGDKIIVDRNEHVWIKSIFGIARLKNCPPVPIVTLAKDVVAYGEKVQLKVQNCSNGQIWSWSNKESAVEDSLVSKDATLELNLLSETKFSVRCSGATCDLTGSNNFTIKVKPTVRLLALDKSSYCQTDSVNIKISIAGDWVVTNKANLILTNKKGLKVPIMHYAVLKNNIGFSIASDIEPGSYVLRFDPLNDEMKSDDTLEFLIHELPTASLFSNKKELVPLVDTTKIEIKLTGNKPWKLSLWTGQFISTDSEINYVNFTLPQSTAYNLGISDLEDKFCSNGRIVNTLTITPVEITNVPNTVNEYELNVYPNPTSDKITIKFDNTVIKEYRFQLYNMKGALIQSFRTKDKVSEWDISSLPLGLYFIKTSGKQGVKSWKILKQ